VLGSGGSVSLGVGDLEKGSPYLKISDRQGVDRLTVEEPHAGSSRLWVGSRDRKQGVDVTVAGVGSALSVFGSEGTQRVSLESSALGRGSAQLSLNGQKGVRRLALAQTVTAALVLSDANHEMRAEMGMFSGRPPEMVLFGPGFKPAIELTLEVEGAALIKVHEHAKNLTRTFK
jgi:hypothetical protein